MLGQYFLKTSLVPPKNHVCMPDILYFHEIVFLENCLLKSFIFLLPAFIFCFSFSHRAKPNLTHQKALRFLFQILFCFVYIFLLQSWQRKVLVWYLINKLLSGWIKFIRLNQARKYFMNKVSCRVQKEFLWERKIMK